jgi:hypothetical protein
MRCTSFLAPAAFACALAFAPSAHATDYRGYFQANAEVDVPSGALAPSLPSLGGGWGFEFGVGLRGIPLMLGVHAGDIYLGGDTIDGPTVLTGSPDSFDITTTTVSRRFELRHLEITARLEPSWMYLRPYVEASAGLAALWRVATLDGVDQELDKWEDQRSVAPVWGAAAGIDIFPWCRDYKDLPWKSQGQGALCAGLTIGAGFWNIGALDAGRVAANAAGDQVELLANTGTLREWTFFAALTFAFEGRKESKESDAPPPAPAEYDVGPPDAPPP